VFSEEVELTQLECYCYGRVFYNFPKLAIRRIETVDLHEAVLYWALNFDYYCLKLTVTALGDGLHPIHDFDFHIYRNATSVTPVYQTTISGLRFSRNHSAPVPLIQAV
jgi:hypothetical protein